MNCCENCKYSTPMVGALACMGQKGMPYVRPTDSCEGWKSRAITHFDEIRAMSVEELARFITQEDFCELTCGSPIPCDGRCESMLLSWLKSPVEVDK